MSIYLLFSLNHFAYSLFSSLYHSFSEYAFLATTKYVEAPELCTGTETAGFKLL